MPCTSGQSPRTPITKANLDLSIRFTSQPSPPLPPAGLVVDGASTISWGEELGVTKYRLYARKKGGSAFRLLYEGPETHYRAEGTSIIEYRVTAVNGNGEDPPSRIVDNDPTAWRNWDPQPNQPFRRTNVRSGAKSAGDYYPK